MRSLGSSCSNCGGRAALRRSRNSSSLSSAMLLKTSVLLPHPAASRASNMSADSMPAIADRRLASSLSSSPFSASRSITAWGSIDQRGRDIMCLGEHGKPKPLLVARPDKGRTSRQAEESLKALDNQQATFRAPPLSGSDSDARRALRQWRRAAGKTDTDEEE
jgi:hypothetical protein